MYFVVGGSSANKDYVTLTHAHKGETYVLCRRGRQRQQRLRNSHTHTRERHMYFVVGGSSANKDYVTLGSDGRDDDGNAVGEHVGCR
jgi:hypothetical protein